MATNEQIFDVRLRISDPPGFITFAEVATKTDLPATPASQTAYLVAADGNYYSTEKPSDAAPSDYSVEELLVSDARIGNWIDLSGEDSATCNSLKGIISQIGRSLQIKKNATGADSVEYQTLKDTYDYYKSMLALCSEEKKSNAGNNSGKWGQTVQPEIAGGNV
jgi:hypothetical protein